MGDIAKRMEEYARERIYTINIANEEKRRAKRKVLNKKNFYEAAVAEAYIYFPSDGRTIPVTIEDVSLTGIGIKAPISVRPMEIILIELRFGVIKGVCIRCEKNDEWGGIL